MRFLWCASLKNARVSTDEQAAFCGSVPPAGMRPSTPARRPVSRSGLQLFLRCCVLFLSLLLVTGAPELRSGQGSSSPPLPQGVEVTAQAVQSEATVGDLIQINLDFTLPEHYQLQFPQLPEQVGQFTILEVREGPEPPAPQETGKDTSPRQEPPGGRQPAVRHHRARIVVAVYKTGAFEFPGLSFRLLDPNGNATEISSPAVPIRIRSVLSQEDQSLKDLKKQAEIAAPPRWLLWLGLGIAAVLFALLLAWWRRRRQAPALPAPSGLPDMDPLDFAESCLRDLAGQGLPEKGMVKQFYVRLSEILKNILEATYGITTAEKTTGEVIHALLTLPGEGRDGIPPAERERIEILLLSSDIVKFARYIPSLAENEDTLKAAFQLLADCRAMRQSIPSGAATGAGVH